MKISKKNYIIGGVMSILLVILITLIIVFAVHSADDDPLTNPAITDPDEIELPYANALIVKVNNSTLWARDVDSDNSLYLVKNWTTPFQSFGFYRKKNIYFGSTIIGHAIASYSKRYPQLSQPGAWYANKIAVDHVNGMVYVLDGLSEKINVYDLLNGYYNVITVDLHQPKDIAIDPLERFLFVLQLSTILKTNLDGSLPKVIVARNDISAFQIDAHEKRIYWATSQDIQSADYEGENSIVIHSKIKNAVVSLAVWNNSLIWLSPAASDDEKPGLTFCDIKNSVCKDTVFDGNAVEIKVYNFDKPRISNPCDTANNCEYMCIDAKDEARCVCSIGWQLNDASGNCETVDEFLLYVQGDFVKGRALNFTQDTFTAAILPLRINVTLKTRKRVLDFDFDARSRELVFSDDYSISKINLKSGSQQFFVSGDPKDKRVNPAVDWITKNVYYVRSFWDYIDVTVQNLEPYDNSTAEYVAFPIHDKTPKSLAVHPNRGFVFITLVGDFYKGQVQILRANLDGTEKKILGQNLSISDLENGLAIDYEEDRLFWFDRDRKTVHSADLEGFDLQTIDVSIVANPTTINIHGNYVYVSNHTTIWRIDKKTGEDILRVLPTFGLESHAKIRGAKVFSAKSQIIEHNHPCADDNGGCKRYCFAKPKTKSTSHELDRVCECNGNEKLDDDGKNCIAFS